MVSSLGTSMATTSGTSGREMSCAPGLAFTSSKNTCHSCGVMCDEGNRRPSSACAAVATSTASSKATHAAPAAILVCIHHIKPVNRGDRRLVPLLYRDDGVGIRRLASHLLDGCKPS